MSPYEEIASPRDLREDCRAVRRLDALATAARRPAPSLRFDDYPREVGKREIEVDVAAQRIANALHLHLD